MLTDCCGQSVGAAANSEEVGTLSEPSWEEPFSSSLWADPQFLMQAFGGWHVLHLAAEKQENCSRYPAL